MITEQRSRCGDMETGSLETFNLQNVLRGLWEDKLTGRRVFWEQLVIKLLETERRSMTELHEKCLN